MTRRGPTLFNVNNIYTIPSPLIASLTSIDNVEAFLKNQKYFRLSERSCGPTVLHLSILGGAEVDAAGIGGSL